MLIEGPFHIQIVDNSDAASRELHLSFSPEFQKLDHESRIKDFRDHITALQQQSQASEDSATQQGILTILQISEQILPHIESDEVPLSETIVIEIGPASPFDQLLSSATLK
ncbi:MAG: hypothetical protein OQL06_10185 [Gammaproteobacteria bacterium]|nr:hypothetical protein [Gammaproteobacteria bacterium]